MIFFAVAGPTAGSASRSFWLAVLRSTGPAGAVEARAGFGARDSLVEAGVDGAAAAGGALPTVTSGVISVIVLAETPAFESSATVA